MNGTAVVVRGWLGICSGNDCGLYQTLDDAKLVADGDHLSDAWAAAMDKRLSIGTDTYFDMVAYHLQFKEVVIRGTVNDHCRNGITFCFDRAGDIDPETIQFII
ncbi:hypothetical protein [Parasphingorhabdus litoris]|uniref:hypothetical protein n=1 Tax=Parasphingorhabdus litoris TaxID=394733 RepID=UPI001E4DD48F|nr:hypothetical protein [Parasphingorhabdus litoris]